MSGRPAASRALVAHLESWLASHWWRPHPSLLSRALQPLAALYGALLRRHQRQLPPPQATPVPVVVVGNFVVGGAGKTPVVIALVQALQARGWTPGVISRGHGRRMRGHADEPLEVKAQSAARQVGDEPLLIHRRTGAPVWVCRERVAAARALCTAHPGVDVLVSDDGLQHQALARMAEWVVFDERGVGNGLLLPAGPLRQPLPVQVPALMQVLSSEPAVNAPLQPALALRRSLGLAWPLQAWWRGEVESAVPLTQLRGRPLWAFAGLAAPEKFFSMLEAAGLTISRHPQPDHAPYDAPPWPAGTPDVITTEKDAVKLVGRASLVQGDSRVWVIGLDLTLPEAGVRQLVQALELHQARTRSHPTAPFHS